MTGAPVWVEVEPQPDEDLVSAIHTRLLDFNRRHAPQLEEERVFVLASREQAVLGGAIAYVYGGWCEVHVLWVEPGERGAGVGAMLMAALEAEVRARGCVGIHTDTFSFQALPFYRGLGYEIFGQIDGFSDGNTRYYLRKRFEP